MIATTTSGKYLVECHFPISFIRDTPDDLWCSDAVYEWRNSINGFHLIPDVRRYGKINTSHLLFWVESVGDLIGRNKWRRDRKLFFEMYIRAAVNTSHDVYDCLSGRYGPHFFMLNVDIDKASHQWGVKVNKFLTPVLIARDYPGYEEAMDNVFSELIPYFQWEPDSSKLPDTNLR